MAPFDTWLYSPQNTWTEIIPSNSQSDSWGWHIPVLQMGKLWFNSLQTLLEFFCLWIIAGSASLTTGIICRTTVTFSHHRGGLSYGGSLVSPSIPSSNHSSQSIIISLFFTDGTHLYLSTVSTYPYILSLLISNCEVTFFLFKSNFRSSIGVGGYVEFHVEAGTSSTGFWGNKEECEVKEGFAISSSYSGCPWLLESCWGLAGTDELETSWTSSVRPAAQQQRLVCALMANWINLCLHGQ